MTSPTHHRHPARGKQRVHKSGTKEPWLRPCAGPAATVPVGPWHWQCPQARAPPRPTPPQPVVLLARTACLQLDYCPQPDRQRQYRLRWRHGGHWWSHTGDLVQWPQAAPPSRHHPCPYYKQLTCVRTGLHRQWVGPAQAAQAAPWSRPCRHAPLGAPELTERGGTAGHCGPLQALQSTIRSSPWSRGQGDSEARVEGEGPGGPEGGGQGWQKPLPLPHPAPAPATMRWLENQKRETGHPR